MRRVLISLLLSCIAITHLSAQGTKVRVAIEGTVVDGEDNSPILQGSVQLVNLPDSSYVTGAATLQAGKFKLPAVVRKKYLLKVSYIGYKTKFIPVDLNKATSYSHSVGTIKLESDAVLLSEATITAEAPQVTVSEDTLVYNSSAYRVQEGAMLEELIKKLPGAEIDADGKITINGQEVKKIMVDGKEFFANDPKVAMKNLPVDMIEKVKSYKKQSDLARVTGIDDGEEEAVIDLSVKKGMNQGWFGNADAGYGNHDRYLVKGIINRFAEGNQATALGNFNNINDRGFGGGWRSSFRRNNGMDEKKEGGANFAYATKKIEVGGHINYSDTDTDLESTSTSETFIQDGKSFSKGNSTQLNRNRNFSSNFKLEWKPDSLTNILFRPSFNFGKSDGFSVRDTRTAESDEFDRWEELIEEDLAINENKSQNSSKGSTVNTSGYLQLNRKLNNKGRNLTLALNYGLNNNDNDQNFYSTIEYFKKEKTDKRDQFITNNNKGYNYRLEATYSEPILKNRFLQFRYSYQYRYQKTDRKTYDLLDFQEGDLLNDYLNQDLSKYAENKYDNHNIALSLRTIREKYQYNIGVSLQPQKNRMEYEQGNVNVDTVRNVVNVTPTFDFRYNFHKQSQLRFNYWGRSSQPSMTNLLPIIDNSNPLNIREGNPGLKPSFTNRFMLFYNNYIAKSQQGIMAHLFFSNTINSVSNKVVYDKETGGRITRPENTNGDWNLRAVFNFNTPFKNKKYTFSTFTRGTYNNFVGFITPDKESEPEKNTTKNLTLREGINTAYRNDVFELGVNGSITYSNSKNTLQKKSDRETFDYSFGMNTDIKLPWDVTFASDASYLMKKGYSEGMDRNELIWNIQVAKNFLKKKQATISLQIFDLLKQQSNLSRAISANLRQDTEYNTINSYFMVHFIYRLNTFGKGGSQPNMPQGRGGHGRGMRRF